MLNIDIRLQTRRHSEAQIAVLAIKPHVGWDEKACRELYQRERERMNVERKVDARERRNNHLFRNIFLRIYFLDRTCESRLRLLLNTHEYIYIYIFDFRKKGKLFFESIYIYILQRIKTEKWEKEEEEEEIEEKEEEKEEWKESEKIEREKRWRRKRKIRRRRQSNTTNKR